MAPHPEEFMRRADEAKRRIRRISPLEMNVLAQSGAVLLDVREQEEFWRGHIDGAVQISSDTLTQHVGAAIPDKATPIVCYCTRGNRGAVAADTLQKMGYRNAVSLEGGLRAYINSR
jgi:phage shock protein E